MRNVKVGKKIFLGFGAVMVLILIILAMTLVTSLDRNNQLKRITTMTNIEREANHLLDDFNEARIDMRTLFTATHADEEYANMVINLDEARARIKTLNDYVDELGSYPQADSYRKAIAQFDALFAELMPKLEQIHVNDLEINDNADILDISAANMAIKTTDLLNMINNLAVSTALEDGAATKARLEEVLAPTVALSAEIDALRTKGIMLSVAQDKSVYDDMNTMLAEIDVKCTEIASHLVTEQGKKAMGDVTSAITDYEDAAKNIVENIDDSTQLTGEARAINDQLATLVNSSVDQISLAVETTMNSLTTTSLAVMFIMVAVVLVAIVFSGVIAVYIGKSITRPLGKMQNVLLQVGTTGNLTFTAEVEKDFMKEAEAKDEIGQSMDAFGKLIDRIIYIGQSLEAIAAKDLTVNVSLLSPEDTMGKSLTTMVENLNDMFAEIKDISSQVATSSNEIAQGAQSLAQGSTQQASTVQEISASINEINEQANVSSETATEAARQGEEISRIAQDGNKKMTQMMESVQQINDASQSIGQVIKVIDDIAFQTNILALNAAVEAARAGEHGKGFAVVADEVRNLAGKSADAAKETANLISANIEKAELGLSISRDTAESLTQIIDGIGKTSGSLKDLAEQSAGSKAATAQVNLAVDQVAQVVQQNSATSEESAAASQEMSSQAQVLEQLIARFKLKDMHPQASANFAQPAPPQIVMPIENYALPPAGAGDVIF